jgi:enoyl-CoA hydratase
MNTSATPPSTAPKVAQVLFSVENNVALITFDHVAARNAMTVGMYERLRSICLEIAQTPSIRVVSSARRGWPILCVWQ